MVTSTELAPPTQYAAPGGLLKQRRDPVLVILGEERVGSRLSCAWVFTHAGLMPGDYPLTDGSTVTVPKGLCGDTARAHRGATLEVKQ